MGRDYSHAYFDLFSKLCVWVEEFKIQFWIYQGANEEKLIWEKYGLSF